MERTPYSPRSDAPILTATPSLAAALSLLLEAAEAGESLQDPWQLAVQVQDLREAAVTATTLRSLVAHGYAQHAVEIIQPRKKKRTFRLMANLAFTETTCFLLTETGVALARQTLAHGHTGHARTAGPMTNAAASTVPTYLRCPDNHRELRFLDQVVKRFSTEAENQETILRDFDKRGWPRWIADPLPHEPGQDPKKRLHDAIARLNGNQANPLIRFHGDGNGQGIYWDRSPETDDSAPTA